jgi:hypothetical protein
MNWEGKKWSWSMEVLPQNIFGGTDEEHEKH